jgi:hypothetical protein
MGSMGRPRRRCLRRSSSLLLLQVRLSSALSVKASPTNNRSCLTARRRRKAGRQPFYGTGWAARPTNAQPYYANQQNAQPAPPYSAAPNTYNNGGGYYGNNNGGANSDYYNQQSGVELQQPQPTYGGYAPPPGPPPAKH